MAVSFSGQMVSALGSDVITSALLELNETAAGETINSNDMAWGLEQLQRLVDQWNAIKEAIFSNTFQQFTLIPNHSPHTIGPTGDFNVSVRPVRIESAAFILNSSGSNPVDSPRIRIVDANWWAAQPLKSLTNSIVTHCYYDPALPNGNLNFWPICNIANPVRLNFWNSLSQALALNTQLGFAPGYWTAIVLELARNLSTSFGPSAVQMAQTLEPRRQEALRVIFANNEGAPIIETSAGTPSARSGVRPNFDFLTGLNDN